eukprot:365489-Chlamydomonas_euryale.AAC.4
MHQLHAAWHDKSCSFCKAHDATPESDWTYTALCPTGHKLVDNARQHPSAAVVVACSWWRACLVGNRLRIQPAQRRHMKKVVAPCHGSTASLHDDLNLAKSARTS